MKRLLMFVYLLALLVSPASALWMTRRGEYREVSQATWDSSAYSAKGWSLVAGLPSPAPTPAPKYDALEALKLQHDLMAISKELSEHTSAPAGLADLEAATLRRLNYIRTLQAAPVSVPDSLSTTR